MHRFFVDFGILKKKMASVLHMLSRDKEGETAKPSTLKENTSFLCNYSLSKCLNNLFFGFGYYGV